MMPTSLMMAIGLSVLGSAIIAMGALFLLSCIMPTFGGSRGSQAGPAVAGGVMVVAGIALVFFAGGVA
jgi:hypothetical protein